MKKGLRQVAVAIQEDFRAVRTLALMKKGLRQPAGALEVAECRSDSCPDEEGIKTSEPCP